MYIKTALEWQINVAPDTLVRALYLVCVFILSPQSVVRSPQSTRYTCLLTDALFFLQSQSSAGDKIQTAGDLLTASARG